MDSLNPAIDLFVLNQFNDGESFLDKTTLFMFPVMQNIINMPSWLHVSMQFDAFKFYSFITIIKVATHYSYNNMLGV